MGHPAILREGHQIRVSVSSANPPRFSANPNTGKALIDDDGTGYIAYATIQAGGNRSGYHMVTIDRLAPDLLSSTGLVRSHMRFDIASLGLLFEC